MHRDMNTTLIDNDVHVFFLTRIVICFIIFRFLFSVVGQRVRDKKSG